MRDIKKYIEKIKSTGDACEKHDLDICLLYFPVTKERRYRLLQVATYCKLCGEIISYKHPIKKGEAGNTLMNNSEILETHKNKEIFMESDIQERNCDV